MLAKPVPKKGSAAQYWRLFFGPSATAAAKSFVEASNATELPWNASDVEDQTCDGNLACAALGLSGFCCPQADGYMFGCCPVLK